MANINKLILVGRLGATPERKERNGKEFSSFSVATSKKFDGKETTQWHRVTVWNENNAKYVNEYADKGSLVYLEGEVQYRQYEKDGVTRYATDVVNGFGHELQILTDYKERSEGARAPRSGGARSYAAAKVKDEPPADSYDDLGNDEIPF